MYQVCIYISRLELRILRQLSVLGQQVEDVFVFVFLYLCVCIYLYLCFEVLVLSTGVASPGCICTPIHLRPSQLKISHYNIYTFVIIIIAIIIIIGIIIIIFIIAIIIIIIRLTTIIIIITIISVLATNIPT